MIRAARLEAVQQLTAALRETLAERDAAAVAAPS